MNAHLQVKHLLPAWETFRNATDITPIRDEAHYRQMSAMLEALLDEAGGNEEHPAMGLVDIVGDLIEDYEAEHHPLPDVTGVQVLKTRLETKRSARGRQPRRGLRNPHRQAGTQYSPDSGTQ